MRINPLAKLLMLVALSVVVLLLTNPLYMLAFVAVVLVAKSLYRAKSLLTRSVMVFSAMIFLVQIVFNQTGDALASYWIFSVTTGGIASGIAIAGKFLCLITMSWIFIATTKPAEFTSALISSGIPYRYALTLSLSMRYVPIFQLELNTVREAQMTRGVRLEKNLRGLVRSIRYTMMPLLLSAMSKVNSLVSSMVGRGFGASPTRTVRRPNPMRSVDGILLASTVAFAVMMLLVDWTCNFDPFGLL